MPFTAYSFIIFMAAVFFLYYLLPKKARWPFLLAASYFFYGFSNFRYIFFLLYVTAVSYFGALLLERQLQKKDRWKEHRGAQMEDREKKKEILSRFDRKTHLTEALVILLLLAVLIVCKYTAFFASLSPAFYAAHEDAIDRIILPIGLSFYVFQSLGYCIDVARGGMPAEHNFFRHALFVSYFPQILQGPIGDYTRLKPQLFAPHDFSYENTVDGLERVAFGFMKKLVIANQIGKIIDPIFADFSGRTGLTLWYALTLYAIELYADFSGYMDIANGCSLMLGIRLDENFDTPYFSSSVAEFWRRWHITLGAWFKNYLFYPLLRSPLVNGLRKRLKAAGHKGLSRQLPNVIALSVIWLAIGFWHGADWSYVCYGIYYGAIIIISSLLEPLYSRFHAKHPLLTQSFGYRLFTILRTFVIVTFGYSIFRLADLSATAAYLKNMFTPQTLSDSVTALAAYTADFPSERFAAGVGTLLLFFADAYQVLRPDRLTWSGNRLVTRKSPAARFALHVCFLLFIIFCGAYGSSDLNQFAYFRF